jgi:hypothetical protein
MFQGYQVFTRHNPTWSAGIAKWGSTIVSWVTIGVLCLLSLGWLVHGYAKGGEWSCQIPSLQQVDVQNGAAPDEVVTENDDQGNWIKKAVKWILYII